MAKKKAIADMERKIRKNWGDVPDREYTHNEYNRIKYFFDNTKGEAGVDDITWNDLGMDDIFLDMNNTMSSVGEENLYKIIRDITFDKEELIRRDKIIEYLQENTDDGMKIEKVFSLMGRTKSISLYEFIHRLSDVQIKSNFRYYGHIILLIAAISTFFIWPEIGIFATILAVGINVVNYYKYKAEVENYFVCFKYLTGMVKGAEQICRMNIPELEEYNKELSELHKELQPVFKGIGLLTTNAMGGSIGEVILDYVRLITHIDLLAFNSMVIKVRKKQEQIDRLYEKLGQIEAYYAIASYRTLLRNTFGYYCKPEFSADRHLDTINVYHPLIDEPVSNSVSTEKGVLLTGSNASGKSTFLKTIAINAVFAQTIFTCTAESFTLRPCYVMSSMALKDNLENNESYYIVEIKSLKRIVDKKDSGHNILCFVDEVLRGTNTVERIAASSEILSSLDAENVICFAATHDIELTHILEEKYNNYHFKEEVKDNDVLFDYVLNKGRAQTRNAIKLLSIMGYDKKIIQSAENLAIKFLETGNWE